MAVASSVFRLRGPRGLSPRSVLRCGRSRDSRDRQEEDLPEGRSAFPVIVTCQGWLFSFGLFSCFRDVRPVCQNCGPWSWPCSGSRGLDFEALCRPGSRPFRLGPGKPVSPSPARGRFSLPCVLQAHWPLGGQLPGSLWGLPRCLWPQAPVCHAGTRHLPSGSVRSRAGTSPQSTCLL